MKRITIALIAALTMLLTACGGSDTAETSALEASTQVEETAKPKANNPLAAEQQLIRDAQAVQGILDQEAERKKQAVEESN